MPRLTTIRAEIGTTGNVESFQLTGDAGADIGRAVELEHSCHYNHCDIREANENDFSFTAAYLLTGAIETHLLDRVCQHYKFSPNAAYHDIPDWEAWLEHFYAHAWECESGCIGFPEYDGDTCDNCLSAYTKRVERTD